MLRISLYLSLLFVFCSCNKELKESSGKEILFEVNVDSDYHLGTKSWIVFSHLNGDIIEYEELTEGGQYVYQIETGLESKFHATIISYRKPVVVEDIWSIREYLNLKTYAFLDGNVNTLNLMVSEDNVQELIDSAKRLEVNLNVKEDDIKESVISGTLTGIKNSNNYGAVKLIDGLETIFTYVHLNGEDNWRMKFLDNVQDNSSHTVNLEEMEDIATQLVMVPDFYEVEFATTGIINCEENHYHSLQWYSPSENGIIASRYLPEDNDLFDHYLTDISLKNENKTYQNIRIGGPIKEYVPIEIDFTIDQKRIDNFQLNTSEDPFTLYEISYSKINQSFVDGESNSSEWILYGDFPDAFISPDLSEILQSNANWFNTDFLELNEVKEYKYSAQANYNDWLENQFDPELNDKACNRYDLNIGDQITSRSIIF